MEFGEQVVSLSVEQLSDRIMESYVLWLLHGRGVEGMTIEEMTSAIKRLAPPRWMAIYIMDKELGLQALSQNPETTFDGFTDLDESAFF